MRKPETRLDQCGSKEDEFLPLMRGALGGAHNR
jgi:hypothetical protein